ncbi:DUF7373 family lipoprotein [Nocardia cyriacigeorgica]|uniref:DUF7373 family lipoprotein n=1 Tax=Nocardia cyriacigeorgica TaxID=135487 RepID=UPI0013D75919|nr:hypothetical protein [Nocardia cyriacigeorgica]NEW28630.1 hypothetical protein [Nocardia cyriacigeorgica]
MIHAARSTLIKTVGAVAMSGALAVTLGACGGSEVEGRAATAKPDLSNLDVGNYQAKPVELGNARNDKQALIRESQRLADFVLLPFEIDDAYVQHDPTRGMKSNVVANSKALSDLVINDTFDDLTDNLVAGWMNSWTTAGAVDEPRRTLHVAVMMFSNSEAAAQVGPALEHDDFTYNAQNQPVAIPKYPETKAHWRPDVSSIGSWTTHGRYVIFLKYVDDTIPPNLGPLVAHVEQALDAQIPLLDQFDPTPADKQGSVPIDPDGVLGRTLPRGSDTFSTLVTPSGAYRSRGAFHSLTLHSLDFVNKADIQAIGVGDSLVFRAGSVEQAKELWNEWKPSTTEPGKGRIASPPKGVDTSIECFTYLHDSGEPRESECVIQAGPYVAQVSSPQIQDLHQKAAAQYALLISE